MKQEYRVSGLFEPISHYTDAVAFGDLVYISGCAPVDANGAIVGGADVKAQTRQVLENMQAVLEAVGASFADILKVTVFLIDVEDRQAVDELRREFFGDSRPASTLIEVPRLALEGMRVEIEATVGRTQ